MFRLSKLGLACIALGFMLYLASLQAQSGLLFLLLGLILACYLINAWRACLSTCLDLAPPQNMTASEGQSMSGTWTVANDGKRPAGLVDVRAPWGEFFQIGTVESGDAVHITPNTTFEKRGVYPFSSLRLHSAFPFGLVSFQRALDCTGEVVVHPGVYPCAPPPAAGFEPMLGGRFHGKHRGSSGDHFHGVRPMQPQDPVKLIHWASSSKGQGLMVREFDEELSGRVGVIVGCDEPYLDWACRAAASLMLSALDQGYQVEYCDLRNRQVTSVPPFADGGVFMDALARLAPEPRQLTPAHIETCVDGLPAKGGLAFVLTGVNAEAADRINALAEQERRKVVVYLPAPLADSVTLRVPVKRYDEWEMQE
ncbi:MAG: hypothetical protein ACI8W8_001464 [Rhodothermales bacterium]|jgi:uncharacterized protein (DUF58 family)